MAPIIPSSLSPHVAILTSPDLDELLKSASLPSLPHILQSFSPLPQVTTRTTTLVSVPHASFALRFTDLHEIENSCREDDDRRAERMVDWITARISHRCVKWVQDVERVGDKDSVRTPWWDELRRCAEGDFVPSKLQGWNHPAALIFAVSTATSNPLQAITSLHSQSIQLPPWVDTNFLRYTLIIHSRDSVLSDEEATALYNAVKKQFGLHSYLLSLTLPRPAPPPVPVPALLPHLPPPPTPDSTPKKSSPTSKSANGPAGPSNPSTLNTLCMAENDIQQTARFTREFVVMSLVPWMEKCVLEWNENFSSTRRLPSRLFSSTRRLFGTPSPSPSPTPVLSTTVSRSSLSSTINLNGVPVPPSQTRRLAEFATILGDFKLAITVWESLRKDTKDGSDILPLLLSPTVSIKHHAQAALMGINSNMMDLSPMEQMRALLYAVRWEAGISTRDFLDDDVEGERWSLTWQNSIKAEEAPSALLLAQAALLCTKKQTWRKAALWYTIAAIRLEKCGVKPLTMYFLGKARELCAVRPQKELSPSFWESEGKSPAKSEGLEDIISGIEHTLGRLLYTTGDVAAAVKLFLGLLRGSSTFRSASTHIEDTAKVRGNDKLYLDDLRVAYSYLKSTEPDKVSTGKLELPFKICVSKHSWPRYPGDTNNDAEVWLARQDDWKLFWTSRGGKEAVVPGGSFNTNELFWIDLSLLNPLDVDITLSNLTLVVQERGPDSTADFVEVEIIQHVLLRAKEPIIVPISLKSTRPAELNVTHAVYDFLSLMPTEESLACRGRRLYDTALQQQSRTYAPDIFIRVEVAPSDHKLTVNFIDDEPLILLQGENRRIMLRLTNLGSNEISEVWMVAGPADELWIVQEDDFLHSDIESEIITSSNLLKPHQPQRLHLKDAHNSVLRPGETIDISLILHSECPGSHELCLLFTFRKDATQAFSSTRLSKHYQVENLLETSALSNPSSAQEHAFIIEVDMTSMLSTVGFNITDIVCVSPQWRCRALSAGMPEAVSPSQCARFLLAASPWLEGKGSQETHDFVLRTFNKVLKGTELDRTLPPPIDLLCSHVFKNSGKFLLQSAAVKNFIHSGRWKYTSAHVSERYASIPSALHPSIFPLYNPASLDFIFFWEIPSQNRLGHTNLHGINLGAEHGALEGIIEDAENVKKKRGMYAETQRENMQIMESIRNGEWNREMNPLVLFVKGLRPTTHDFLAGPCHVSVEFFLRNHSLKVPARYTLKLQSNAPASPGFIPTTYTGRLTFQGEIAPSQTVTIKPKLWVTHPGTYRLGGWSLETEISVGYWDGSHQRALKRQYLQQSSPEDTACVIVYDSRTTWITVDGHNPKRCNK